MSKRAQPKRKVPAGRKPASTTPELKKENADLKREVERLQRQQTATADVLKIISRSTFDLQVVLDTLVESSGRLCQADMVALARPKGTTYSFEATFGASREYQEFVASYPAAIDRGTGVGRALVDGKIAHIHDVLADADYTYTEGQKIGGFRTLLGVPLLRDGVPIGAISLQRKTVRPFTDKQIELATTFADQAAIAIENARLFSEVRARTSELAESLAQQTATADVLRVISRSPFEIQPVLDALIELAARLCRADTGIIAHQRGSTFRAVAGHGHDVQEWRSVQATPIKIGRGSFIGRAVIESRTIHIPDILADPEWDSTPMQAIAGFRSVLGIPLMREGVPIGVIGLGRKTVRPFTDNQIALVTTFADQAVIAIENARLFDEVQARTHELTEALEQQTATSEVLKVISRSTFDLQTVLDTLVDSATHLCDAESAHIFRWNGTAYQLAACRGYSREYEQFMSTRQFPPARDSLVGRIASERQIVHIHDVLVDPEYHQPEAQLLGRFRTMLGVPLLREGVPIGALTVTRSVVRPFTDRQIELLKTFADQAVIAIENVRLFDQVQARTRDLTESLEQQTATAEVLKVISRSTFDLQMVLNTLVESVTRLCDAYDSLIFLQEGYHLHVKAHYGPLLLDFNEWPIGRTWITGRAFLDRAPVHVDDAQAVVREYPEGGDMALRLGYRTILSVPLLRESVAVGAITIRRSEVKPFTERQVELVRTYADQAVIAIENTRLLNELRESLQQQTATADVLKVISRSVFDLKPVLESVIENACRLCEADKGFIYRVYGEIGHFAEAYNASPELLNFLANNPVQRARNSVTGRVLLERQTIHVEDVQNDPEYDFVQKVGVRTTLGVPMLREVNLLGVIIIYREEVRPFTERQIKLVETFADQAVIAIENVRLFEEIQDKSSQLEIASQHKSQFLANMSSRASDAAERHSRIH